MLSNLQNLNIIKLHGYCIDGEDILLVYEFTENDLHLVMPWKTSSSLDHYIGTLVPSDSLLHLIPPSFSLKKDDQVIESIIPFFWGNYIFSLKRISGLQNSFFFFPIFLVLRELQLKLQFWS